jgi:hypothetical protein
MKVLDRLRDAGMSLKASKCNFFTDKVDFLGHVVTAEGTKPNPKTVKAIVDMSKPKTKQKLQSFLGMTGYYRRFIRDYARIANPLTGLTRKEVEAKLDSAWKHEHDEAFDKLRTALTEDTILWHPDFSRHFYVITDASTNGLGAVLAQIDDEGRERVVEYASRSLRPDEKKWTVTELEALGVVWACERFRPYIYGTRFTCITDHWALKWLLQIQKPGRLMRWALRLQDYTFDVVHRAGKQNGNSDGLSRIPIPWEDLIKQGDLVDAEDKQDDRMFGMTATTGREDETDMVFQSEFPKPEPTAVDVTDKRRNAWWSLLKEQHTAAYLPTPEEIRASTIENTFMS